MSDERIEELVSDLVLHIDYDIWKSLFEEDCIEDPEEAAETRARLIATVKDCLNE